MANIKINEFSGDAYDDILASEWINLYDSIATDNNWSHSNKLIRLGGYLRSYALRWYIVYIKGCDSLDSINWSVLKIRFAQQFQSSKLCHLYEQKSSSSSGSDNSNL